MSADAGRTQPTDSDFVRAAESLPYTAWIAAPNGFTEYFNRRGAQYAGFLPAANYGWDWISLVHPDDVPAVRDAWRSATSNGTPYEFVYRLRRRDGQFRSHRCLALPVLHREGRIIKWVGIAVEIHEGQADEASHLAGDRAAAATSASESDLMPESGWLPEPADLWQVVKTLKEWAKR